MDRSIRAVTEQAVSTPLIFDPKVCNGCNECIEVCQVDLMVPNPVKSKPPIILYPEECWYGGCCVAACPRPGAIKLNHPLMNRVHWKRSSVEK